MKVVVLTILLGLIIPAAGAAGPDRITLSSDTGWLVANGTDSAGITVRVLHESGAPFENCTVTLSVDPIFGRFSPATVTTDASGTAVARLIANRTSGVAVIAARAGEVEETLLQPIDHDLPFRIGYVRYDSEVTAGTTTTITVGVADRHGNPVDDRRVAETVRFSVGSIDDDAVFTDGGGASVRELEKTVNETGFARADLRTGRIVGENIVRVTVLPGGVDRYISIYGQPTGLPAAIDLGVSPDADPVPYRPADGASTFTLTCRLSDAWGNPAAGRDFSVVTSLGESLIMTTNSSGVAGLTYGPKDTTGRITVTATAVDNTSVTVSRVVEFIHTDPTDLLLSANPQSMPSRDVYPSAVSTVRAKIIDEKGNPVRGENVAFSIRNSDAGGFVQVKEPYLSDVSAETDADGYAAVRFYPGAFTTDRNMPGWSAAATGTATVRATWGGVSRDIVLTWENYPYLSVETEVSPETVTVNDTVDVTVRLRGDGWALRPDPIDVMLCTDRSGSMLKDNPDRMIKAMEAARVFNARMNYPQDRLGLVSFGKKGQTSLIDYSQDAGGWLGRDTTTTDDRSYRNANYNGDRYYSEYAVVDLELSDNPSTINTTVARMIPDSGTPMRYGIYKAINELRDRGRDGAVKAVIVLSDGDYNWYGDPLARGAAQSWDPSRFGDLTKDYLSFGGLGYGPMSSQNMSVYAASNNVRIYSIAFASDITDGGKKTLRALAESSGGKYYYAPTGDDLAAIYTAIANDLKTEAGVNTRMDLDFDTLLVNSEVRAGESVFAYIYEGGVSTTVESWVDNETGHYQIVARKIINQADDWNDDHKLSFDIGTVHLGQTWEATFRLRVLTDGNINVFGPESAITFNDGLILGLPDTFITAVPDLADADLDSATLAVANPRYTCAEPVTEFLTVAWDLAYTGSETVTEAVEYSNDGGLSWVRFGVLTARGTSAGETSSLHVQGLPPGEYLVRVYATAPDAPDAWGACGSIQVGNPQRDFIRIR